MARPPSITRSLEVLKRTVPPGAVVLAAVLSELGFAPRIITDEACRPVVEEAATSVDCRQTPRFAPVDRSEGRQWLKQLTSEEWAASLTHRWRSSESGRPITGNRLDGTTRRGQGWQL